MVKIVSFKEARDGVADCLKCSLRESVLFADLKEEDFEKLHDPIDQYTLPVGSTLYHSGDKGDRMYTVRTGILKLVQYLPDGSQRIVRLIRSTDITGLECILGEPYQHDAVVLQETEVCALPVRVVDNLSKENPALHLELLNRWQRALKEADAWLTELSTGSAKQRVARLLLRLVKDTHESQCSLFAREDMGAMLGITTETASRTIAEFKRQSLLIETAPNQFLLDTPNLHRIAED
ncbi:MAG: Crp/Fnr family transcriptional regulator [Candidatus Thiodiazotropha lotti]|uniref:Crp/Fnr family transcriptional regulator n=1 Tax=Candidatus Thiodiazotropha endoloripes TaxID=1818881 RepID=A0A1E2UQI8_9GAMM|nr:Crp/Fnr family transcriptional regulator [Candidatus Thiodiazotropha endoloripes]MCG7898437.1 Crp/Fnr family transcriptional regulator [Candidatus Thiodiazotropha weberae]MCG7992329.1 Crp/Fnr family transcriptional regulator [Candidatus Thiodiazotropha lotti]MCG7902379.1 Crp/Fnr family transcriptional regulator [Candidatus Thiodiazotropha weberae]MCG7912835.1 Crp/Fnr family transcriptional regulator [Candidatus Thiodiazotropha weberae]MCG8000353.1 Crp/Fnr family transcriptional regulator [C